ncbi:MAG TPA: TetR family transcriptional regulator [Solirubrobacterales bacterium]|nr:TetR family transcriptional regulator [Solirubrobacterales bacterium]
MGAGAGKPADLRALTRESIRRQLAETAWDAFAERGFDEVTAAEVAQAAGISRASFFRYFGSKEEAVFAALETMGAEIATALAERPSGEDAWVALRRAFDAAIPSYKRDPARSLARLRLTRETPALRAHQLERQAQWREMIGAVLASRLGAEPGDVRIEALAAAALGALDAATERWAVSEGSLDLIALIDDAFDAVSGRHPKLG